MGLKGRTFHIRITPDQEARFDEIAANYKGLASAVIMRMLILDQLRKSNSEIDQVILSQIKGEKNITTKDNSTVRRQYEAVTEFVTGC